MGARANRRFSVWASGLAIFSVVLAMAGCADDGSSGDGDGGEAVRLAALDQGTSGLALKTIEVLELDKKYGFDATYDYVSADVSTQNFLQDLVDINFNSAPNDAALATLSGVDTVAISSEAVFHQTVIAPADSPYENMADLKGKKIGWYGSDSTGAVVSGYLLDKYEGIDFFNDYKFADSAPSALVQLLKAGQVEAIVDFQPWNSWAESQVPGGVKVIFSPNEVWEEETGGELWMTAVATKRKYLESNREDAENVVKAWCEAADYLNNQMDKVQENEELVKFLEPLDEAGLAAFADWVTETKPFHCGWTEDQIDNANMFLDELAAQGDLIEENPGGAVESIVDQTSE